MYAVQYNTLTDFIADKCVFTVGDDITYLSIHSAEGSKRKYLIEKEGKVDGKNIYRGKVYRPQFFVENINDTCYIADIMHIKGTSRLSMRLRLAKVVEKILADITTVKDLIKIITPGLIPIYTYNGVTGKQKANKDDESLIDHVEINEFEIIIHTKF